MKRMRSMIVVLWLGGMALADAVIFGDGQIDTAYTYQGRLETADDLAGKKISGVYDFRFSFYTDPNGVNRIGGNDEPEIVPTIVTAGLFSLEFHLPAGDMAQLAAPIYLRVEVRRSNSEDPFIAIGRLQRIGTVPRALFAANGAFPGEIKAWAGRLKHVDGSSNLPPGWKLCDGSIVSREEFNALYDAIGDSWGDGADGEGPNFNLPDLCGRFLRGVDKDALNNNKGRDPDSDNRIGENGGNSMNEVGSIQHYATGMPKYNDFKAENAGTHQHQIKTYYPGTTSASRWYVHSSHAGDYTLLHDYSVFTEPDGSHIHTITGGDQETRPENAYVYWIIYTGIFE